MKIYAISGLGADERVFKNLALEAELVTIPWISFHPKDTLKSYALRLIDSYNIHENDLLIGVSFGGMLAAEIAESTGLKKVILISSASGYQELPGLFQIKWPIKCVPNFIINVFKPIATLFFGTKDKQLMKAILKDSDPAFVKNAIHLILHWRKNVNNQLLSIHGKDDLIIPLSKKQNQHIVPGGHLMVVDESEKVSQVINDLIKKWEVN